jgi:hypothetical protein
MKDLALMSRMGHGKRISKTFDISYTIGVANVYTNGIGDVTDMKCKIYCLAKVLSFLYLSSIESAV